MTGDGEQSNPTLPLAELADEQVVVRHRQGDEQAFGELVRRYRTELLRFLIRFMGSRAPAEDVFQDTFLQIHQSLDTFDVEKRLKPWLFTIAANKARDALRRNKRRQTVALSAPVSNSDGDTTSFVDLMAGDLPGPEDVAQHAELRQQVRLMVDQLPDHLREILVLAYFQQLAYKEIAEHLSIPLGTVKSRLHSAVASFAQLWQQHQPETETETEADNRQAG